MFISCYFQDGVLITWNWISQSEKEHIYSAFGCMLSQLHTCAVYTGDVAEIWGFLPVQS